MVMMMIEEYLLLLIPLLLVRVLCQMKCWWLFLMVVFFLFWVLVFAMAFFWFSHMHILSLYCWTVLNFWVLGSTELWLQLSKLFLNEEFYFLFAGIIYWIWVIFFSVLVIVSMYLNCCILMLIQLRCPVISLMKARSCSHSLSHKCLFCSHQYLIFTI